MVKGIGSGVLRMRSEKGNRGVMKIEREVGPEAAEPSAEP